jgi:hypothetical protein
VSTVKIDATILKQDASTVSIDLSTLTADIGTVKQDVAAMKTDLANLTASGLPATPTIAAAGKAIGQAAAKANGEIDQVNADVTGQISSRSVGSVSPRLTLSRRVRFTNRLTNRRMICGFPVPIPPFHSGRAAPCPGPPSGCLAARPGRATRSLWLCPDAGSHVLVLITAAEPVPRHRSRHYPTQTPSPEPDCCRT